MRYQALICDVDGTLIENSREALPSARVRAAISKARGKALIGIATARPYLFVKPVMETVELTSPCILGNGVQIYDPLTDKVLIENQLPTNDIKEISQIVQELGVVCTVQETHARIPLTPDYSPVNPLYIFVPTFPEELTATFLDAMSQIENVIVHKMIAWEKGKVDYFITNHKATKQQAVLEVAQILGIKTEEIIGVGDGYNDFPLLMACGLKVAMGNAVEDLKAIADYVAPTVDQDGVADVIEKYILKSRRRHLE